MSALYLLTVAMYEQIKLNLSR